MPTPAPSKGVGAGFKIDDENGILTDVSNWIRTIAPSQNITRIPYGTLQPDDPAPVTPELGGARTRGYTLTVLYHKAGFEFFKAIEGMDGLAYQHGPDGFTVGDLKISGLCNCLNVGVPGAAAEGDSLQDFTVELSCSSQDIGEF